MLIGILSDTHGHALAARAGVRLLRDRGARILLHCGDVGGEAVLDELSGGRVAFVWGNNDLDRLPLANYARLLGLECMDTLGSVEVAGKEIAITHGDDYRVLHRLRTSQKHDYVLFGHTHVPSDERTGRTRMINPGALYRARPKTVALLDLTTDGLIYEQIDI